MQSDKVVFYFQEHLLKLIPDDIRDKVAFAGGCVRDKLLDVEIKDYDIFVDSKETEDKLMAFLKKAGKGGKINTQTANYTFNGKWIQVVRGKYYNINSSDIIDSFDFTICQAMITTKGLQTTPRFWKAVATKHLEVSVLHFPLSSLERMVKYIKKGYTP